MIHEFETIFEDEIPKSRQLKKVKDEQYIHLCFVY